MCVDVRPYFLCFLSYILFMIHLSGYDEFHFFTRKHGLQGGIEQVPFKHPPSCPPNPIRMFHQGGVSFEPIRIVGEIHRRMHFIELVFSRHHKLSVNTSSVFHIGYYRTIRVFYNNEFDEVHFPTDSTTKTIRVGSKHTTGYWIL